MKKMIHFRYDSETQCIVCDMTAACGNRFNRVAFIVDVGSTNPGLLLPNPLGIHAIKTILQGLELWKSEGDVVFELEF